MHKLSGFTNLLKQWLFIWHQGGQTKRVADNCVDVKNINNINQSNTFEDARYQVNE